MGQQQLNVRSEQLDQKAKDEFLSLQLFIRRSCLVVEVDQNLSEQSADGLLGSGGGREAFYNALFSLSCRNREMIMLSLDL